MAITNASRLADFGSGIGTAGAVIQIDNANQRVGIGTNNPLTTLQVAGIVSATSFSGNLTGTVTGNLSGTASTATAAATAYGLTGSPNITVGNITGTGATFANLTVNGTQTIINTTSLEVADKNIGIGSTSTPTDTLADGAGITIYGTTNKTLTWARNSSSFEYSDPNKFKGVIETVSAATTYNSAAGALVLEMDVRQATTYTYTIPTGANIGIVSFKNMPAPTGNSSGTTITCILTQNAAGTGNTTATTGIGTNCTVIGYENSAAVAGISTRALVGSGTTLTLSTTASDRDFVSFFVHYTGASNTSASSYQVYVTKNGGFR